MECTAFEGATGPLIGAIVRTLREWDLGEFSCRRQVRGMVRAPAAHAAARRH